MIVSMISVLVMMMTMTDDCCAEIVLSQEKISYDYCYNCYFIKIIITINIILIFCTLGGYDGDDTAVGGVKNHIKDLENILLQKKTCLQNGGEVCSIPSNDIDNYENNCDNEKSDINNINSNEDKILKKVDKKSQLMKDEKIEKKNKKNKKNNKKDLFNKNKMDKSVDVERTESDGDYIRRIELEAVNLLLVLLPSCA